MGRGTAVPINPSVLRWAIEESGFSEGDVSASLKVTGEILNRWMTGEEQPNLTLFKRLSALLKRPTAVFFLPKPPSIQRPRVDFRHPPNAPRLLLNPQEHRSLREVARLQEALAWILCELHDAPADVPNVSLGADVEKVSLMARQRIGIDVEAQLGWSTSSEALHEWRRALEHHGVFVFLLSLGKTSSRGFSLWNEHAPLIAANTSWNNEARIYTFFHEYGHLLTRTNSACLGSGRAFFAKGGDKTERWCESFSAAFLIPWDACLQVLKELGWESDTSIQDVELVSRLAKRFKVSLRAAALRVINKGLAGWSLYEQLPGKADYKRPGGGRGRNRLEAREAAYGRRATQAFVAALDQDLIDRSDATDYLNISDRELEQLEQNTSL